VNHVFGPVPSRRLGFSLGVDPVVPKTCTMDCVYCELGPTTDRTVHRACYVEIDGILEELERRLSEPLRLDFVTLSGSGEPTLNAGIDRLIAGIRELTDTPIAVLTNGSLLTDPDVRSALQTADVVAPSLDAVSQGPFDRVNRPHPSLDPGAIVDALTSFSAEYTGRIWLEVLLVAGMNDDPVEIALIQKAARAIAPDRIHLNSVLRPPSVSDARPVNAETLREIAAGFGDAAEIIAAPSGPGQVLVESNVVELITSMAARRPVTVSDVARAIGTNEAVAAKTLAVLVEKGRLTLVRHGESQYYRLNSRKGRP